MWKFTHNEFYQARIFLKLFYVNLHKTTNAILAFNSAIYIIRKYIVH